MAINLWEQASLKTSYNPFPSNVSITALSYGEYELTFSAKSPSGATLRVTDNGNLSYTYNTVLTPTMTNYKFNLFQKPVSNRFYIFDLLPSNDIVIENIKLVEKPMGKATINGVDGFLSGKWTLHPNAKVIDDSTLELNATSSFSKSFLDVPVEAGQELTMSIGENPISGARLAGEWLNASNGSISFTAEVKINEMSKTFIVPTTASKLRISLDNTGTAPVGKFLFKKPVINLGSIPFPYEPKRGERMVLPEAAGKNLIPSMLTYRGYNVTGSTNISNGNYRLIELPTIPKGIYTLKINNAEYSGLKLRLINGEGAQVSSGSYISNVEVLTMPNDSKLYINMRYVDTSPIIGDITTDNLMIQLEEGTIATPYEQPRTQYFKKAIKEPKNNLIKPYGSAVFDYTLKVNGWVQGALTIDKFSDYSFTYWTSTQYRGIGYHHFIDASLVGKQVTFSGLMSGAIANVSWVIRFYNDATQISQTVLNDGKGGEKKVTTTIPAGTNRIYVFVELGSINAVTTIDKLQLEIGDIGFISSPFEPYKLTSRKANKLPEKNPIINILDWTGLWSNSTASKTSDAVRVTIDTAKQAVSAFNHSNAQIPIIEGKTYVLTYMARANRNGVTVNYTYLLKGGVGGGNKVFSTYPILTTEWTKCTQTVLCNYTTDGYAMIGISGTADGNLNGDWMEFKDVQLDEGSPTPYAPLKLSQRPARKGLEFDGNSNVKIDHAMLTEFNFEVDFIFDRNNTGNYTYLLNIAGASANYIAVRNSDNTFFISLFVDNAQKVFSTGYKIIPGIRYKMKVVWSPTDSIKVYSDGILVAEQFSYFNGTLNTSPNSIIGASTSASIGGWIGSIERVKLNNLYEINFNKPNKNLGSVFKTENGLNGTINGNPIQLNALSRR
jgi:hypothetical protein